MTTCGKCATTFKGHAAEHCTACCQTFGSTEAGDRHRTGQHGVKVGPDRRRCMTKFEMLAAGLIQNAVGRWVRYRVRSEPGQASGLAQAGTEGYAGNPLPSRATVSASCQALSGSAA